MLENEIPVFGQKLGSVRTPSTESVVSVTGLCVIPKALIKNRYERQQEWMTFKPTDFTF
jgi:hypothetical protein